MKRKITGAILISLGLGLFWQALAEGLDCQTQCRESYVDCSDLAHKSINPIRSLKICNDAFLRCLGNWVNCPPTPPPPPHARHAPGTPPTPTPPAPQSPAT